MIRKNRIFSIIVFFCLWSSILSASYFDNEEGDTFSTGMGKTSFLSDTGSGALFRNPALLGDLKQISMNSNFSLKKLYLNAIYTDNNSQVYSFPANTDASLKINSISIAFPIKYGTNKNIGLALGYKTYNDFKLKYDALQSNGEDPDHLMKDNRGALSHLSLGIGFQINNKINIGSSYHLGLFSKALIKDFDDNKIKTYHFDFNYQVLSLNYQINENIMAGIGYKSEFVVKQKASDYSKSIYFPEELTLAFKINYHKLSAVIEYNLPNIIKTVNINYPHSLRDNANNLRIGCNYDFKQINVSTGIYHDEQFEGSKHLANITGYTLGFNYYLNQYLCLNLASDFSNSDNKIFNKPQNYKAYKYFSGFTFKY